MPGVIEEDDPGPGSIHTEAHRLSSYPGDVPPFDVERFVDRLRFMGLDHDLVDEAEHRLRAAPEAGMRWLAHQLNELAPPRRPPTCDCGEPLVTIAWRGRATVRCSACGSRWGIEVVAEETESLWALSGPTAEWLEAHPIVDHDPSDEFPPDDVLREGLPPLPSEIAPGTSFPVAVWEGGTDAAVLSVHRLLPGEFDFPGDQYEHETEHLVRDDDGDWVSAGGGGGNWIDVFDPPSDLLAKYVVIQTGVSGHGDGHGAIYFIGGLCSEVVAAVETVDLAGTRTYRIDPDRPIFLVGLRGWGRVRIIGRDGQVVEGPRGERLDFPVGGGAPWND